MILLVCHSLRSGDIVCTFFFGARIGSERETESQRHPVVVPVKRPSTCSVNQSRGWGTGVALVVGLVSKLPCVTYATTVFFSSQECSLECRAKRLNLYLGFWSSMETWT